ncbi:hypothetical protein QN366_04790 [Pseudomonas sp. CCC3.2]|uniref:hypothetical protein n=1 Tax=unclassified Pseudomonas TaxID=196821 RepID=UPI002AB4A0D6|nr:MULTISPECIES: hypothetical protein [unclassified Pseudomonas]MDY7559970.1 hypothetical protein [Pseudomonas sp. AB6]MEA9994531.1 hypothetical protein [Pseudomonas sp. AA4]MEB0085675.1 hypothetical protein [Pseudomonas sp. RTI1]MEB0125999.1 hypothetical protein [Pseudomonas sp. CCC1.2]MEB0152804.1 hypothetical protein [Pseudomonas sp. CCC4.3]
MANKKRTYQWVDGQIQELGAARSREAKPNYEKPVALMKTYKTGPVMGIQTALLLFTFSSVLLVFAGGALLALMLVAYALIFG